MVPPRHIAILGGGLTGLSSAFHLARKFPQALITLLEQNTKLGGWAQSERIEVKDSDGVPYTVLLEAGPRTLRPNAKSVLELIHLLGLRDSLVLTPKTSPAARKRYLYRRGSQGLTPLPSSIPSLLTSPLRSLFFRAGMHDTFRPSISYDDESVDSFLSRHFGEEFAVTFGSALVHGIYAADSRQLSLRSAFPSLAQAEERGRGRVISGLLLPARKANSTSSPTYELGDIDSVMADVSVYSFRDGLSAIVTALRTHLAARQNVRVLSETGVSSLSVESDGSMKVLTTTGVNISPSHMVSSLPLPKLHAMLPRSSPFALPHLTANPSSSVKVANFIFPSTSHFHPEGFGYLIPRPKSGYDTTLSENPGILGTVFDSCALAAQDSPVSSSGHAAGRPPIKVTMMLGGPYEHALIHDIPISTLLSHLSSHLGGTPIPDPIYSRIIYHRDCIPTLAPGHLNRMNELRRALREGPWKGRLEVVGAGVGGVSVGDCVEAGRMVGANWK